MNAAPRGRGDRRRSVAAMVVVTLMWSIAGVVTRHLQAAESFEVTFWRSAFCAVAIATFLAVTRGTRRLVDDVGRGGWVLFASALCWATMFTAFMLALTWTDVATVLVTMAIGPLVTAVFARLFLGHALPWHGWVAIGIAGLGLAWMQRGQGLATEGRALGAGVAALVPLAAACNFTLLQSVETRIGPGTRPSMPTALGVGAAISALVTLPGAWPFHATAHDLGWLALLGVAQLAIPCLMVVSIAKTMSAPEIALVGTLEVVFGVLWAWLGAGEVPAPTVLQGGAMAVAALVMHEVIGRPRLARPSTD